MSDAFRIVPNSNFYGKIFLKSEKGLETDVTLPAAICECS